MPSFLGYAAAPEQRSANGLNAVITSDVADIAAAKAAAIAAMVNGGTADVNNWTFVQISANALTNLAAAVTWLDGVYSLGASSRTF